MLLSNGMVDFLVEGIRGLHDFNLTELKEKNVTDSKIKIVFKRNTLKTSIEFGTKEMSAVVYDNFISQGFRDEITFEEFHFDFVNRIIESTKEFKDVTSVEEAIFELCEDIVHAKLPFPKAKPTTPEVVEIEEEIEEVEVDEETGEIIEEDAEEMEEDIDLEELSLQGAEEEDILDDVEEEEVIEEVVKPKRKYNKKKKTEEEENV